MNFLNVISAFQKNNFGTLTADQVIGQLKPNPPNEMINLIKRYQSYTKKINLSWNSCEFYYAASLPVTFEGNQMTKDHIDSTILVTQNAFLGLGYQWTYNNKSKDWVNLNNF